MVGFSKAGRPGQCGLWDVGECKRSSWFERERLTLAAWLATKILIREAHIIKCTYCKDYPCFTLSWRLKYRTFIATHLTCFSLFSLSTPSLQTSKTLIHLNTRQPMFSSLTVSTHKDFTDNLLFDIVLMLLNKTVLDVEGFLIVVIFSFLDTKTNLMLMLLQRLIPQFPQSSYSHLLSSCFETHVNRFY